MSQVNAYFSMRLDARLIGLVYIQLRLAGSGSSQKLHPGFSSVLFTTARGSLKSWISPEMATSASGGRTEENKQSILSSLPKHLPLDFLKSITDQFSEKRIIGEGGFGIVYEGTMPDGETIAVKKLAENSPLPRDKAFNNVVQNIMALQHENVVRLVGYCHESQKKVVQNNGRYIVADIVESVLCYEYLPGGSLKKNLFGDTQMDWDTRFNIIKGVCEGLLFVHSIPIVHMDLKPENILLDSNMVPKIADFGLSRLFGQEQTRMNTQNVVGSYGYIAPEYLYRGEISTKSDIYSLGVLILETTTREENCSGNKPSAEQFIEKVRETWNEQRITSVYPSLEADCLQQVKKCIEIGLRCVDIKRENRPSIKEIIDLLNGQHLATRSYWYEIDYPHGILMAVPAYQI